MRPAVALLAALSMFAASPAAEGAGMEEPRVVAEYALERAPQPGERLVLYTSGGQTRLLVRSAPSPASVPALPLLTDLRGEAREAVFGAEGRCSSTRTGDAISLSCSPGSRPAGMLLRFAGRMPRRAALQAVIRTSGAGGYSAQFVRAGEDASTAAPLAGEQRLPLPQTGEEPVHLVILAPPGGGQVRIDGLALASAAVPRAHPAGAWAWEPRRWRQGGEALIRDAAARRIERLYVTLPIEDGQVQHRRDLIRFLRAASAAGIAIEAVEGDPRMVTPEGLSGAVARARAIRAYQESAPADARLAGVQYDIEPYVLPGWGSPPLDHQAWSAAVHALARASGRPLHLVLPFWIANEEAGARFLADIAPSVGAITVMSYRTDRAALTAIAEPLLHWGAVHAKPIRLALEAGPVAAETEESFAPAPSGRLALVERNGSSVALLLEADGTVPGAFMYASGGPVETRPDVVSFLGDEARMMATARDLAPLFSSWASFAGIDYHGLAWRER